MKLITQEEIGLFYKYFVQAGKEGDRICDGAERRSTDDLFYLMFSDLLEVAQNLVGVDGKVAREEVNAINELFATAGYHTGWLKLKLESSVIPPLQAKSDLLNDLAAARFAIYEKEGFTARALEDALSVLEAFLYVWTTFMCEIIISDRDFSQEETDLLLNYLGEYCDQVSGLFKTEFVLSHRIREQLRAAVQACYHG